VCIGWISIELTKLQEPDLSKEKNTVLTRTLKGGGK